MSRNDGRRDGTPDPSSAPPRDETIDDVLRAIARSPPRSLRPELLPGQRLKDRYVVERRIGAGGMGTVYAARDELLDKVVALKVLHPIPDEDPGAGRARITREARLAARVEHERVARVYDFGEQDGNYFVVMEFVEGITLRAWMAQTLVPSSLFETGAPTVRDDALRSLPLWHQLQELLCGIAEGLGVLHEREIVHRDLKPENVMLVNGHVVKLLDFGLARTIPGMDSHSGQRSDSTLTSIPLDSITGWSGTPGYMAPERFQGAPPRPQADIFALGVIAYECMTGRRPFDARNPAEVLKSVERGADFSHAGWKLYPHVRAATEVMLAADPDRRFANGPEALAALQRPKKLDKPNGSFGSGLRGNGRTILWVDDRPGDNRTERAAFRSMGFQIQLATSTEGALRDLSRAAFAAVISNMAREEGPREGDALLESMRARGDATPFFLYSTFGAPSAARELLVRGGQGATDEEAALVRLVTAAIRHGQRGDYSRRDSPVLPFIARPVRDRISVRCTNIVTLDVDAIVTPTDSEMLGDGFGVTGAIQKSGGAGLVAECEALGWCAVGEAKIGQGHRLRARHVIYTVGPLWSGGGSNEERVLESCYARVFALAREHGLRTIASPCISAGGRAYPIVPAARVAVRSVAKALASSGIPEQVVLCDVSSEVTDAITATLDAWTLG